MNTLDNITLQNAFVDGGQAQGFTVRHGTVANTLITEAQLYDTTLAGTVKIGNHTLTIDRFEEIIKKLQMEMFPEDFI